MMVSIAEIVLYTKPTAERQYLLRLPCHPLHTKRAFPFSLALRIRRGTQKYPSSSRIPPSPSLKCHLFFTSTLIFTFPHPPNFMLLCLKIYLSLPSYVRTSRKFAKSVTKWTSRSEPKLSIHVMVLYTVQSPLIVRKIVENERYRRPS